MSYIQKGYKNRWVEYLQMSLVSLGYSIGPCGIDGHFGSGTEEAVYQFQADNDLDEDGKVGDNTWDAIKDHIIPIQQKLIEKGYSVGSCGADGIYGYSTVEAVKNFQKNNGLNVDGIAGPNTQDVLFNSSFNLSSSLLAKFLLNSNPKPKPEPTFSPEVLSIAGSLFKKYQEQKQSNEIDLNKIDLLKLYDVIKNFKLHDDNNFIDICNRIISKVFNFIKIDIKITSLDTTYTCKAGFLKVTLNAKSGGDFSFGGDKYIFKNSNHHKTEGLLLNSLDLLSDKISLIVVPQIKRNIEMFKQKVGEAIVNGSVSIKIEFGKLIYEFQVAKKDDFSKIYGTLTITLELNFDLSNVAQKIGVQIDKSLGVIRVVALTLFQIVAIAGVIIGILYSVVDPVTAESIISVFK